MQLINVCFDIFACACVTGHIYKIKLVDFALSVFVSDFPHMCKRN